MIQSKGYAAHNATSPLQRFEFQRQALGQSDILLEIAYCGVCHSDIHQVRSEWFDGIYPMVPGHEIVGTVTEVGKNVKKFQVGDLVGVGCMVDACLQCPSCQNHEEQFCQKGAVMTYNSQYYDTGRPTYGGYSNNMVVREEFALKISPALDLARVAPLLCAGITTYSPLRKWKIGAGHRVGVIGLGGLGHMAIKFAASLGAHVVVFTRTESKCKEALNLGAHEAVLTKEEVSAFNNYLNSMDLIINTVSASHSLNDYLVLLKKDCPMVMVGLPDAPQQVLLRDIVIPPRLLTGSLIGGIQETQEMLDYCAEHQILSDIELIPIDKINIAYERILKSDVKYRFVIDMKTLT